MRRILFPVLGALVALVLAGCTITIEPVIPPNPVKVTANTTPNTPVFDDSLAAGSAEVFELTIPDTVRNNFDVVYLELDQDIELELRSGNYASQIATSNSKTFFARNNLGLTTADADLDAQGIAVTVPCRGSCIIFEPSASTYYARVRNDSGSAVSYSLYLFGDVLQDTTEPDNGSRATAPALTAGGDESGAIEVLGDIDYWEVFGSGTVTFTTNGADVDVRVTVLDSNGLFISGPHAHNSQFPVVDGDYLLVESDRDRAGASAESGYFLSLP